jgi:hypothetical protein
MALKKKKKCSIFCKIKILFENACQRELFCLFTIFVSQTDVAL